MGGSAIVRHFFNFHYPPVEIFSICSVVMIQIIQIFNKLLRAFKIFCVDHRMRGHHSLIIRFCSPPHNRHCSHQEAVIENFFRDVVSAVEAVFKRKVKLVVFYNFLVLDCSIFWEAASSKVHRETGCYERVHKGSAHSSSSCYFAIRHNPNRKAALLSQQVLDILRWVSAPFADQLKQNTG